MRHFVRVVCALFVIGVWAVACGSATTSTGGADSNRVGTSAPLDAFGHGLRADLGIYLKAGTPDNDVTSASSQLLYQTTPGRVGEKMVEGVHRVQIDYGVPAIYVDFETGVSDERVSELIAIALASPVVVETRRDVVVGG